MSPHRASPPTGPSLQFPNVRDIAEHLHFSPDRGRIWLDEQRMLLWPSASFHSLRAELVALLGIDAARGLLTRCGYLAGCRDASFAMKARGSDHFKAFMVGPQLHALKGMAEIELIDFRMDVSAGTLYGDFIFKDSFEDEALSDGDPGSESACWVLVGYSSGYSSTFMGKRILVREVECRANGRSQCRAIARPVEEWPDPDDDLRYLQPLTPAAPQRRAGEPRRAPTAVLPPSSSEDSFKTVGGSAAFNNILHHINRVAATRATVLLLGESGVGKSLFAREVHDRSKRRDRPFVVVNCAAIPESLMESELFGTERGAFTGASTARAGRFEMADGGTLFLDEIATLSLTAQGKLLRVLQTGEFERLGSTQTRRADVRLIAATNADLPEAIEAKRFREDLYFRLNVFPIVIPPLRERRDDIPLLVGHYLAYFSSRHERHLPGITPRALAELLSHDWPGNVRELENVIERGVILADEGQPLDRVHLPAASSRAESLEVMRLDYRGELVPGDGGIDSRAFAAGLASGVALDLPAANARAMKAALARCNGNVAKAARLLGLTRAQLDYRLRKLRTHTAH